MRKRTIGGKAGWMKYWLDKAFLAFFIFSLTVACSGNREPIVQVDEVTEEILEEKTLFGYSLSEYDAVTEEVLAGWTLSHMLSPHGISGAEIYEADLKSRDSLVDLKYIVAGRSYTVFYPKNDTNNRAHYIVYESSIVDFVAFSFVDSVHVSKVNKPVTVELKTLTGKIEQNSNLTQAINDKTGNIALTGELAEAIAGIFAWSIDFFKLQVDDEFKVIYQEKNVEGVPYGIDRVEAVWFKHWNSSNYAFYFENDSIEKVEGYYDESGKEMKRPFLMAPVQYSRISSGFSANRFHPVQKRYKAHLGTDYAAPEGTPIFTTADGTVVEATRSQFNGIYVKVRHNDTYTTQYLHMSKIAEGIKTGTRVKQGQTIGYVGSTGLATGPHVCYRFWKNGKQVNHRAEKLPTTVPLKAEILPIYKTFIAPIKAELDSAK